MQIKKLDNIFFFICCHNGIFYVFGLCVAKLIFALTLLNKHSLNKDKFIKKSANSMLFLCLKLGRFRDKAYDLIVKKKSEKFC